MANIHEIKSAYDDLQVRYANTLGMLLDALDRLDEKPTEVEVEKIVEVEATMDVDLSTPDNIKAFLLKNLCNLTTNSTTYPRYKHLRRNISFAVCHDGENLQNFQDKKKTNLSGQIDQIINIFKLS